MIQYANTMKRKDGMDGSNRFWLSLWALCFAAMLGGLLILQRGNMDVRDKIAKATTCEGAVILANDLYSTSTNESLTVRLMMCKINPLKAVQDAKDVSNIGK
jgi:hypothetical protein